MDINEIIPNQLFISDYKTAYNLAILEKYGIQKVISLVDRKFLNQWCGKERSKRFKSPYNVCLTRDLPDYPIEEYFYKIFKLLSQIENIPTLIHCEQGYSRSPMAAIFWLMQYHNWNVDSTLEWLRTKRNVGPNLGFIIKLKSFATLISTLQSNLPSNFIIPILYRISILSLDNTWKKIIIEK